MDVLQGIRTVKAGKRPMTIAVNGRFFGLIMSDSQSKFGKEEPNFGRFFCVAVVCV